MKLFRLLPVFLVLLQSGQGVAHPHTHAGLVGHTEAPHLHLCELFALFGPLHGGEDGHDGHEYDHDHDAVDISALMASATPPTIEHTALDLAVVGAQPAFAVVTRLSFPVGLPPSTAGPLRPLYLTYCALTI